MTSHNSFKEIFAIRLILGFCSFTSAPGLKYVTPCSFSLDFFLNHFSLHFFLSQVWKMGLQIITCSRIALQLLLLFVFFYFFGLPSIERFLEEEVINDNFLSSGDADQNRLCHEFILVYLDNL